MQTLGEMANLLQGTWRNFVRHFPTLGMLYCLAWTGRELSTLVAVLFGANRIAALLFFVLGLVIWVTGLVLMLHLVTADLVCFEFIDASAGTPQVAVRSRRDAVVDAILPFLLVGAAWGMTEEHVQRAFSVNMTHHGIDADNFAISFTAWPMYLAAAAVGWVLLGTWQLLTRNRQDIPTAGVTVFLRGVTLLTAFMGLARFGSIVVNWITTRRIWVAAEQNLVDLIDLLPDWQMPWELTIPDTITAAMSAVWNHLVPGLFDTVVMPLVWLALTATVVGWHDFTHGVANGRLATLVVTRAEQLRQSRVGVRLARAHGTSAVGLARFWLTNQVEDFLPALQALRLIIRSGWAFLGAYLVLGAAARALDTWTRDGLMWLIQPQYYGVSLIYLGAVELISGLVAVPLAVCLYAAAFDRAMLGAVAHARHLQLTSSLEP